MSHRPAEQPGEVVSGEDNSFDFARAARTASLEVHGEDVYTLDVPADASLGEVIALLNALGVFLSVRQGEQPPGPRRCWRFERTVSAEEKLAGLRREVPV